MTALLIVLLLLGIAFGAGAVIKGLLWLVAIAIALVALAVIVGYRKLRQATGGG
jgi:hypothetical protein